MIKAGLSFHRNTKIFVTHMHGDHILGLPGILQTMSLLARTMKLEIHGPPGIEAFVEAIEQTIQFALTFPVQIHEIKSPDVVCEERQYEVYAAWANHSVPALAYGFVEKARPGKFYPEKAKDLGVPEGPLWSKLQRGLMIHLADGRVVRPEKVVGLPRQGRKIVYSGDTRPSKDLTKLAEKADLLIHEATFDDDLRKRADEDGHSTPTQAAQVARDANVRSLILTHVSARYKNSSILLEQAKKTFSHTNVAEDFMRTDLPISKVLV
jgi:ribonuclease Z